MYFSPVKCSEAAQVQREGFTSATQIDLLWSVQTHKDDIFLKMEKYFYNTHVYLPMPDAVFPDFPECTPLQCSSIEHGLDI